MLLADWSWGLYCMYLIIVCFFAQLLSAFGYFRMYINVIIGLSKEAMLLLLMLMLLMLEYKPARRMEEHPWSKTPTFTVRNEGHWSVTFAQKFYKGQWEPSKMTTARCIPSIDLHSTRKKSKITNAYYLFQIRAWYNSFLSITTSSGQIFLVADPTPPKHLAWCHSYYSYASLKPIL